MNSVLQYVPLDAIIDHYRTMIMHRYPSELCGVFKKVVPEMNRHAPDGTCATLLYHYILNHYRQTDNLRILSIVEQTQEKAIEIQRIFTAYLYGSDKSVIVSYPTFDEHPFDEQSFDLIIFECYQKRDFDYLFECQEKAFTLLKKGGFVCFEGLPPNACDRVFSTWSPYYLYPDVYQQRIFTPFALVKNPIFIGICQKKSNICPWEWKPLLPSTNEPYNFVHITSAVRSIGNNTVFSERNRFRQLLFSIRSVVKKIPNPYIVVSDIHEFTNDQIILLKHEHVQEIYTFSDLEGVHKSIAEANVLMRVLGQTFNKNLNFGSYTKLSGRYLLLEHMNSFDPTRITCKRLRPNEVMTRYFSFPWNLTQRLHEVLTIMIDDTRFKNEEIDIEHMFGELFNELNDAAVSTEILGIGGFITGNCQVVHE